MNTMEEIKEEILQVEQDSIGKAVELLAKYNGDMRNYLLKITAALCEVSEEDLLKNTSHIEIIQSRWLYWYAYRKMTNDSYESIARKSDNGRKFGAACVGQSITKMTRMICNDPIWKKRWDALKQIMGIMLDKVDLIPVTKNVTIHITHPKGVNVELKEE